jgi:hypothetical protein
MYVASDIPRYSDRHHLLRCDMCDKNKS